MLDLKLDFIKILIVLIVDFVYDFDFEFTYTLIQFLRDFEMRIWIKYIDSFDFDFEFTYTLIEFLRDLKLDFNKILIVLILILNLRTR